jgi:AcrR family transcriptional regulator
VATPLGLRERKRRRTYDTISAKAIALFLERGYDQVSVADVADAAEVSKPTLFRYFASKEELVVHRFADHQGEAARVVAGRPDGVSPVEALHRHFAAGLAARDPVTGLNDHPNVLAYHRMVFSTPSLVARLAAYVAADEPGATGPNLMRAAPLTTCTPTRWPPPTTPSSCCAPACLKTWPPGSATPIRRRG